jgi:hypothetical protein
MWSVSPGRFQRGRGFICYEILAWGLFRFNAAPLVLLVSVGDAVSYRGSQTSAQWCVLNTWHTPMPVGGPNPGQPRSPRPGFSLTMGGDQDGLVSLQPVPIDYELSPGAQFGEGARMVGGAERDK